MDPIKELLTQKLAFVKNRVANNQIPTPPQLASFFQTLVTALKSLIRKAVPFIVAGLRRRFAAVGWDVVTNKSIRATPPAVGEVCALLEGCLSDIEENLVKIDVEPKAEELADLSAACSRMWELDVERLTPGHDYQLNLQHGKKPYQVTARSE